MKRALLIAGGTVGGLGAVLSVTPPQLGGNGISTLAGASASTSTPGNNSSAAVVTTPTTTTTTTTAKKAAATTAKKATATTKKATTKKATTSKSSATSNSATSSNTSTSNSTTTTNSNSNTAAAETQPAPAPTPTKAAAPAGTTGSFTGDAFNVGYGMVQVKITVTNGKITDAVAVQAPSGRSQRFTDYAVPNLRQQTLSAQSASIRGVSGASYTSYGWYKSLISALQKAGMTTGV